MRLSIVIPVYNSIKYLSDCVGSVLTQSFPDYEIVLVDDGSSDGSERLCDRLAAEHAFIRVLHQPNGGASSARNAGIRAAKGDYIHFIDSDDMLANDRVYEELSEILDGENEIIFFRRERIVEGKDGIDAVQPEYHIDGSYRGDVLGHVLESNYELTLTCPVNKIFLRSFLLANDLFFTVGLDHEEDEWLPRVIACARCVWFSKGVYYTVRNHPESLSKKPGEDAAASRARSKVRIAVTGMEYMEKKDLSPDTMALAAEYYWNYMVDACVACSRLSSKSSRQSIYAALRESISFFDSRRYLRSRNRRMLGLSFRLLGVRPTVRMIGIRYGK